MLFQRPYISKFSGGACPRTPLAARAFCARDCVIAPTPNKSNRIRGPGILQSSPLTLQNNAYPRSSNN